MQKTIKVKNTFDGVKNTIKIETIKYEERYKTYMDIIGMDRHKLEKICVMS